MSSSVTGVARSEGNGPGFVPASGGRAAAGGSAAAAPARDRTPEPAPPRWSRKRFKALLKWVLIPAGAVVVALALVVRFVPWGGPVVADTLRAVIGDRGVTWLEESWAAVEDLSRRVTRLRAPPRRLGDVSPALAPLPPSEELATPAAGGSGEPAVGGATESVLFPPPAPAVPPFAKVAAVDDGRWYPVADPERPHAPPFAYRTLIHPDPQRSFAELFLVALPVPQISLHVVAGTAEPETSNPLAEGLAHRGLIDPADESQLLAAFNGGFKARHGRHGMLVDDVLLVPMRIGMCTISGGASAALRIASWQQDEVAQAGAWYRQTPPCMIEQGVLHPGLANPESRKWGSTLEGETVIRRSALGLDGSGNVLYMGVSNATTARALALGMQSAGAWTVAQLDVNWSYPRFLIFPRDASGTRHAAALFSGFLFEPEEMLRQPSPRDFFYVTRRAPAPP